MIDRGLGRYLTFGHGGLIRRPLKGPWSGQGAAGYRTAAALLPDRDLPEEPLLGVVRLHLAAYGPASRRDVAWWSGLGLRQVDSLLDRLDLTWRDGPGGLPYADVPDAPDGRDCPAYTSPGVRRRALRLRPQAPRPLRRPGRPRPAVAQEQRIHARAGARGRPDRRLLADRGIRPEKTLAVSSFASSRKPRKAELDAPATALSTALGMSLGAVTVGRV